MGPAAPLAGAPVGTPAGGPTRSASAAARGASDRGRGGRDPVAGALGAALPPATADAGPADAAPDPIALAAGEGPGAGADVGLQAPRVNAQSARQSARHRGGVATRATGRAGVAGFTGAEDSTRARCVRPVGRWAPKPPGSADARPVRGNLQRAFRTGRCTHTVGRPERKFQGALRTTGPRPSSTSDPWRFLDALEKRSRNRKRAPPPPCRNLCWGLALGVWGHGGKAPRGSGARGENRRFRLA